MRRRSSGVRSTTSGRRGPVNRRCALGLLAVAVFGAACGSSGSAATGPHSPSDAEPHAPPGGRTGADVDTEFSNAVKAVIGATSFDFAITTRTGRQPVAHATGSFVSPDRS